MTGYVRTLKTMAVNALESVCQITYPEPDAAGGEKPVYASVEFPVAPAQYPGIWVDYEDAYLRIAGVDYTETDALGNMVTRWRFQGHIVFTIVALSSNERDLIYDQLVSQIAFAAQSDHPSAFRTYVDSNTMVDTTWSYEVIEGRGVSAGQGTPWLSDEWVYERSIAVQVTGDFATDPVTLQLVPLTEIQIIAIPEDGPGPMTLTID